MAQYTDMLSVTEKEMQRNLSPIETYCFHRTASAMETARRVSTQKARRAIWLTLMFYIGLLLWAWIAEGSWMIGFISGAGAATVLIQWRLLHDQKKRLAADMARITANEYLIEIFEDGYRVSVLSPDREVLRLFSTWEEVVGAWRTSEYLIFYDRIMLHYLPVAEIAADSRMYTGLSAKIKQNYVRAAKSDAPRIEASIPDRLQKVCKMFTALTVLALIAAFVLFPSMIWALSRYAIPLYALLLIFPIGSFVCGVACTRRGGKGKSNRDLGIVVAVIIALVGVGAFLFSNVISSSFPMDSTHAYELAQTADIDLPPDLEVVYAVQTPELELSDSNAFTRVCYHAELVLDEDAEAFLEQIRNDPRWLQPLPTEMRGVLPDTAITFTGNADYVLLYRMTDDSYNQLPAEDGSYRYLCFIYRANSGILDIYHYDLIHEAS